MSRRRNDSLCARFDEISVTDLLRVTAECYNPPCNCCRWNRNVSIHAFTCCSLSKDYTIETEIVSDESMPQTWSSTA